MERRLNNQGGSAVPNEPERAKRRQPSLLRKLLGIGRVAGAVGEEQGGKFTSSRARVTYVLAGLLLSLLYGVHLSRCQSSALPYFPYLFQNSDMYANLVWAKSINDQGWLNPHPYHPYTFWMARFGTYEQWVKWWGGDVVFQQSPLYAYVVAAFQHFTTDLVYIRVLQAALSILLCVLLGLVAARITRSRLGGWLAFGVAGLYAPFYVYSWTLLRDLLGWVITAGLLLVLVCLQETPWRSRRAWLLSLLAGALLGLGYLARETFLLIIPVVFAGMTWQAVKQKEFKAPLFAAGGLVLLLLPLVIRNASVGAPVLSSSNRFAEALIEGHDANGSPVAFVVPKDIGTLLQESQGNHWVLARKVLQTHAGVLAFCRFEFAKVLSLFDPFEVPDNLSIYFMERISPLVRWGIKHWMLIIPGLGGLALSLFQRDRKHAWLWAFFPILLAGVLINIPLSRYRQSLAVLWIPWAAYFLVALWRSRHKPKVAAGMLGFLLLGWGLCLGPLAIHPKTAYERPAEFDLSAEIYEKLGRKAEAQQMRDLSASKFPFVPRHAAGDGH